MADAYRITGFPRLHLGLIDLSGVTRRAYGGAGLAVNGLSTIVSVRPSSDRTIESRRLSNAARVAIGKALDAASAAGWDTRVHIKILCSPPEHVGLGSTTTTVMCTLRGVAALQGRVPDPEVLQWLSRRGRTSGIGINAFFGGGFVVDVGQPREAVHAGYLPSSLGAGNRPSKWVMSFPIPLSWRVSLLLDERAPVTHGSAEADFFRMHTPVRSEDALRMLAELYHGILPAILDKDLGGLADALRDFQSRGFKRAEIASQPPRVQALLDHVHWKTRLPCGLSSMGPVVFVIHDVSEAPVLDARGLTVLGPFPFRNEGHECVLED